MCGLSSHLCTLTTPMQVSRRLSTICNSLLVWRHFASAIMTRCRPLILRNYPVLSSLSASQLKRSIVRATILEQKWSEDNAPRLGDARKVALKFPVTNPRSLFYTVYFKNYLLSPSEDRRLTVWDLETRRTVGKYDMRRSFAASGLILAVKEDYMANSLYYIITGDLVTA